MARHFSQLFWGLLIVNIALSFNDFDILPDGIGYLIVAAGCRGLAIHSNRFVTAQALCFVLAVLWLIGFGVHGKNAVPYGLAMMVVKCVMTWQLLGGVREIAMARLRQDLVERAGNRRIAYVGIMVASSLLPFVVHGSRNLGPLAIILVVPLIVAMFVIVGMILHLIHRVKVELAI